MGRIGIPPSRCLVTSLSLIVVITWCDRHSLRIALLSVEGQECRFDGQNVLDTRLPPARHTPNHSQLRKS